MRTVAIIQARMGSTRLPGKVLKEIEGRTMLARVVDRTRRARRVDDIVVATTTRGVDDAIRDACRDLDVPLFRGSEDDVLDRYHRAAQEHHADPVVRVTADCPLLDPEVADRVVDTYLERQPDYASNVSERTFPQGLDVEVIRRDALARAWREAKEPYERTHVTPYVYRHPERFRLIAVRADRDYSQFRWTVDTEEDLEFVRNVYRGLGPDRAFGWREILDLLTKDPALMDVNRHVRRKALEEG